MQLNKSFVEDVKQTLEDSIFTLEDFKLSTSDTTSALLKINFVYYSEYEFSIYEAMERTEQVTSDTFSFGNKTTKYEKNQKTYVEFSPGEYKSTDTIDLYNGIGDLISYIPKWCQYIRNDLYAKTPKKDPLEELRNKFKIELENLVENPDDYFEEGEVLKVDERFEILYKKIEELQEEFSITKEQLKEIKKEFSEFKESAKSYPKGMWARITNNKLVSSLGGILNSKEGRELLFNQVKKLLEN